MSYLLSSKPCYSKASLNYHCFSFTLHNKSCRLFTIPIRCLTIPCCSFSLRILTFPLLSFGRQLSHHSFDTSKSLSLLINKINCCSNSGILSESRLSASSIKIGSLTSFIFWNPLTISASHRILSP